MAVVIVAKCYVNQVIRQAMAAVIAPVVLCQCTIRQSLPACQQSPLSSPVITANLVSLSSMCVCVLGLPHHHCPSVLSVSSKLRIHSLFFPSWPFWLRHTDWLKLCAGEVATIKVAPSERLVWSLEQQQQQQPKEKRAFQWWQLFVAGDLCCGC